MLSAYDRAAKSETELMVTKKTLAETTEFLTSTRKDLNDAKDSLAKALEMHAEKTESEMKIEENLQQVGALSFALLLSNIKFTSPHELAFD